MCTFSPVVLPLTWIIEITSHGAGVSCLGPHKHWPSSGRYPLWMPLSTPRTRQHASQGTPLVTINDSAIGRQQSIKIPAHWMGDSLLHYSLDKSPHFRAPATKALIIYVHWESPTRLILDHFMIFCFISQWLTQWRLTSVDRFTIAFSYKP